MGVRIYVYAVDVAQVSIIASASLHDLLWYYADQPSTSEDLQTLDIHEFDPFRTYYSSPQHGVYSVDRRAKKKLELSKEDTLHLPFLSSKVSDYFSQLDSIHLLFFFKCFSACPNIGWVYPVTSRHRRGWIGSFLDYAESALGSTSQDYGLLTMLFQKVLRGYDCGKVLPKQEYLLSDFKFPIMPDEDIDQRIGVWTHDETRNFLQILEAITTPDMPSFRIPSGKVGIAPDTDDEWNEWVRGRIGEYMQVKTLTFEDLNLLSFIT